MRGDIKANQCCPGVRSRLDIADFQCFQVLLLDNNVTS